MEYFFEIEDVWLGFIVRKVILLLVDFLRSMLDRFSVFLIAVRFLILIVDGSEVNKLIMVELGVLEVFFKYLLLSF